MGGLIIEMCVCVCMCYWGIWIASVAVPDTNKVKLNAFSDRAS